MDTQDIVKRLAPVMDEWPAGSLIRHRADNRRGVIMGYSILVDGEITLRIDYGGGGWANEKPASLQSEGETWQEVVE